MKHTKWTKSFTSRICTFAVTAAVLISGIAITTFAAASLDVSINGKPIILSPTAEDGYVYAGCTISWVDEAGESQTVELSADELHFFMPTEDITITPKFIPDTNVNLIDTGSVVG